MIFLLNKNKYGKYTNANELLRVDHYGLMACMPDIARAVVACMNYSQQPAMNRSQLKMPIYLQRLSCASL